MRHTDALAALEALRATSLRAPTRAVYLVMLVRTDDNGVCWPGVDALAADAGMSPANVRRSVGQLLAAGLIGRVMGGGRGHTNLYTLAVALVPNPAQLARVPDEKPARVRRETRASWTRKPARVRPPNVSLNVEKNGRALWADPELDGHEHHRAGDCSDCDAGRARVARMLGDLSVWTPANDPRIGRWK